MVAGSPRAVASGSAAAPPATGPEVGRADAPLYWRRDLPGPDGATGQPDAARALPRLAGQHAAYLERQLLDAAAGRRPNMAGAHRTVLRSLTPGDAAGGADYLSRMK